MLTDEMKAAGLTNAELHILQHSLGVDQYGQGEQYRNYFVTGEGSIDHPHCLALVSRALMTVRRGNALTGDMDLFHVTDLGKAVMADASPAAPKLTAGQKRYRQWLDADGDLPFIDYCRRKPETPHAD